MDFSDLFSGDTWDAISPIIQGGAAIAGGINGMQNAKNFRNAQAGALSNLDQLYSPNSPYAQQLRQQLERRDAAAGRRSQYGPRETELAAKLTNARAGELMNPQYSALQRGANASPYGALAGALGYLTGGQKGKSNPLVNTASRLNTLRKGYNTLSGLFGPAETGTAADLGGAGSAFGNTLGESGAYAPDVFSTGGGVFGSPTDLTLSPFSATNVNDPLGSFASSVGNTGYLGLGGAGDFGGAAGALSGMGTGSLAGTVGGADALGSLAGGTGFLPAYTSTAGTSGLFGGGAGAGASAGTEAGGLGASGLGGVASLTALPFGLAIGGMLNGLFGKADGPAATARDQANAYAQHAATYGLGGQQLTPDMVDWMQRSQGFGGGSLLMGGGANPNYSDSPLVSSYLNQQYGNQPNYTEDQYRNAQGHFQGMFANQSDNASGG